MELSKAEQNICPIMSGYTIEPEKSAVRPARSVFKHVECVEDRCAWWKLYIVGDGDCVMKHIPNQDT